MWPPAMKKWAMETIIFPKYGRGGDWLAIESNPRTRAMYWRLGIRSTFVRSAPWTTFEEMLMSAV